MRNYYFKVEKLVWVTIVLGIVLSPEYGFCGGDSPSSTRTSVEKHNVGVVRNYVNEKKQNLQQHIQDIKVNKLTRDARYKTNPTYQRMSHADRLQMEKSIQKGNRNRAFMGVE